MAWWSLSTESAHRADLSPVAGTGSTQLLHPHDLWNQGPYLVVPFKGILENCSVCICVNACVCVCVCKARRLVKAQRSTWGEEFFLFSWSACETWVFPLIKVEAVFKPKLVCSRCNMFAKHQWEQISTFAVLGFRRTKSARDWTKWNGLHRTTRGEKLITPHTSSSRRTRSRRSSMAQSWKSHNLLYSPDCVLNSLTRPFEHGKAVGRSTAGTKGAEHNIWSTCRGCKVVR